MHQCADRACRANGPALKKARTRAPADSGAKQAAATAQAGLHATGAKAHAEAPGDACVKVAAAATVGGPQAAGAKAPLHDFFLKASQKRARREADVAAAREAERLVAEEQQRLHAEVGHPASLTLVGSEDVMLFFARSHLRWLGVQHTLISRQEPPCLPCGNCLVACKQKSRVAAGRRLQNTFIIALQNSAAAGFPARKGRTLSLRARI